ncbi:hypothetical protein Tco_0640721, partial [Tanacetum coccineum]
MATPIDFSKFVLNRLKIDKLTMLKLIAFVFFPCLYNLLKGTCQNSIELEYNMEECYKALSDQLDWNNPEGDRYPKKKYTTSITKTKVVRYELVGIDDMIPSLWSETKILSVKSVKVNKLHGYGLLEEIVVRRADRQLYKFKEGDFVNLHLNDICGSICFFLLFTNTSYSNFAEVLSIINLAVGYALCSLEVSSSKEESRIQNRRDLPMDIPLDRIEVLRYDTKGVKVRKRIMQTKTELTLEQTQQGVSDEVL